MLEHATLPELALKVYPQVLQHDLLRYSSGPAERSSSSTSRCRAVWRRAKSGPNGLPARRSCEILASLRTVLIFSMVGLSIVLAVRPGFLDVYTDPAERGWPYFALNVVVLIVAHDAWFYWSHRLMHRPRLFRLFHRLHHRSNNPSPWASYAFDVGEAVVNTIYLPIALLVMPSSALAAFIFTGHMMLRNAIGHCGYEVFPARSDGRPLLGWLTTVTHHDLHHARAGTNFGFYFSFWDRIMGTQDPTYHEAFARAVGHRPPTAAAAGVRP